MAKRKWDELSTRARRLIIVGTVFEGALKIVALIDLARRPATEVRGSKVGWAVGITLINSAGLVPIVYFTYGRRRPSATI